MSTGNIDDRTVAGFGDEWSTFDQSGLDERELGQLFDQYFAVFPWDRLPSDPVGADLGCGSGRWATLVAPRVGVLHCVDASGEALAVARQNLAGQDNCVFHHVPLDATGIPEGGLDFAYSLGVLHHIPDTQAALAACARLLKPGAPLLVYLYYALDNRPGWYRALWRASDACRRLLSHAPHPVKLVASGMIATLVYLPLARVAKITRRPNAPLAYYADRSFYTMRTDAYDRFATLLEQRFTREQVAAMMTAAGLTDVRFSPSEPYWCAVGLRAA